MVIVTLLNVPLFAEGDELDYKQQGLKHLRANEVDLALHYLDYAFRENAYDGEVLGGIAIAYTLRGDEKRGLQYAKKALRQADSVYCDTYLAGILAYEAKGQLLLRDRWLKKGLKLYPNDYLLLFHGGRIKKSRDNRESERLLLHSAHANPGFEETHLLLGQNMYLQGENLKAVLPLLFFLLLENDSEKSKNVETIIEYVYNSWGASAQGISKINTAGNGVKCNFIPEEYKGTTYDRKNRCQWFVSQTMKLMESMPSMETTSNSVLWEFYSDFFKRAVELHKSQALAWHIVYSMYPSDVLEWIAGNGSEYKDMIDWLSLQ